MKTITYFVALSTLSGLSVFAQDAPRFEITGDYSYMQFNPTVSGLQSRALNGGGGQVQANFGKYFGIKGDFQGYGSTQWTLTSSGPTATPNGTIPAGTFKSNGNMFTYMFGPVVEVHAKRVNVFGEVLLGASHTNGYASLISAINAAGGKITGSASQDPFTLAFGGGIDVKASKNVAFRLGEFDYVMTRLTNPLTQTNNQNNFRYLAGVVITFGAN